MLILSNIIINRDQISHVVKNEAELSIIVVLKDSTKIDISKIEKIDTLERLNTFYTVIYSQLQ